MIRALQRACAPLAAAILLSGCGAGDWIKSSEIFASGDTPQSIGSLGDPEPMGQQRNTAEIYVSLAVEYLRHGEYESALENARRAEQVDPSNASAQNVLALIYEQLGEFAAARQHFQKAVGFAPKDPYIHNAYGAFLCKRGEHKAADREFQAALANPLYRTPAVALTNGGVCALQDGDLKRAETYLRKALQADKNNGMALYSMAKLMHERDDQFEAYTYLERYHDIAKPSAKSLWLGIRIARAHGDRDAIASYELLLRSNFPDSEEYAKLLRADR